MNKESGFLEDDFGNRVSLKSSPQRLVSLAPNITEMIFLLGKGKNLVGVTDYCDWPIDAKWIEKVGGIVNPNIEKIASLKPDLVIGIDQGRAKPLIDRLSSLGVKLYIISIKQIGDIRTAMEEIASITGADLNNNNGYRKFSDALDSFLKDERPKRTANTLLIISTNPLFVATDRSLEGEVIERLGGMVPGSSFGQRYSIFGREALLRFSPSLIILPKGKHGGYKVPAIMELAEQGNPLPKIVEIDEDIILRASPRIIEGIATIRAAIAGFSGSRTPQD